MISLDSYVGGTGGRTSVATLKNGAKVMDSGGCLCPAKVVRRGDWRSRAGDFVVLATESRYLVCTGDTIVDGRAVGDIQPGDVITTIGGIQKVSRKDYHPAVESADVELHNGHPFWANGFKVCRAVCAAETEEDDDTQDILQPPPRKKRGRPRKIPVCGLGEVI